MSVFTGNPVEDRWLANAAQATWAAAHDAATATVQATGSGQVDARQLAPNFYLSRDIIRVDTSSIGSSATITSATYAINITVRGTGANSYELVEVTGSGAISTYDFGNVTTTVISDSITAPASGTMTFTLNATGLAYINKTGETRFAIRETAHDVANVSPTNGVNDYITFDDYTTANKPLLTVNYTVVTNNGAGFFMLMR